MLIILCQKIWTINNKLYGFMLVKITFIHNITP